MLRHWQSIIDRRFIAILVACLVGTAIGTRGFTFFTSPASRAAAQRSAQVLNARAAVLAAWQSDTAAAAAPPRTQTTDALIRSTQAMVQRQPSSATAYANLALAYMQKERETSDVTYYQLTDDALNSALRLDPTNSAAIDYKAWVALGRHDFSQAAALARRSILLNPHDPGNYANLGDAEANLGNYSSMVRAYQNMVDLKPSLAAYNRASYARWLFGDDRGANGYMLLAIRAGSTMPENVAWCESQLGDDYFNQGFVMGAALQYHAALHTFPHYARALAGLANVDASLGHMASAVRYYRQAIAIVPLPQYVAGLGDLYQVMGRRSSSQQEYRLLGVIYHLFQVNQVQFGPEEAMFDADHNQHLGQALAIIEKAAQVRHDVQTEDTLAWVLYKNGRYADAWKAEAKALRLHTHYALLFFHAGMIQGKLGNIIEGQSYLSEALMLSPNFNPLLAPQARAELNRLNRIANRSAPKATRKP